MYHEDKWPESVRDRKRVFKKVLRPESITEKLRQAEQDSIDSESEQTVVNRSTRVKVPNKKYAAPECTNLVNVET